MNQKQIRKTNDHYADMFCDNISPDTIEILTEVTDIHDLEMERQNMSAGEFDAAEAILLKL